MITILFYEVEEAEVFNRLHAPTSGFEASSRQPLRSDYADAIAVTGVVLSAAQLALTIYQIKVAKPPSNEGTEVRVEIEHPDGTITRLEAKNVQELEATLR